MPLVLADATGRVRRVDGLGGEYDLMLALLVVEGSLYTYVLSMRLSDCTVMANLTVCILPEATESLMK